MGHLDMHDFDFQRGFLPMESIVQLLNLHFTFSSRFPCSGNIVILKLLNVA
jgi:hypothetical protein